MLSQIHHDFGAGLFPLLVGRADGVEETLPLDVVHKRGKRKFVLPELALT